MQGLHVSVAPLPQELEPRSKKDFYLFVSSKNRDEIFSLTEFLFSSKQSERWQEKN